MQIEEIGINGFVLAQEDKYLKLGTDAVLLSDFARIPKNARVCDLGCGNGAICVLLAARREDVSLCGLEIVPGAAQLAQENARLNNISHRMQVVCGDICEVEKYLKKGEFDAVVSNPPYMPAGSGVPTACPELLGAKMEMHCNIWDVCRCAGYLLQDGGRFSLVYRPERLSDLFLALNDAGFAPKRMRLVQNKADAAPSLVLVEARKGAKPGLESMPVLCIRNADGSETDEVKKIYHREK